MALTRDSVLHFWSARYGAVPIIGSKPVHTRSGAAKWVDGQGVLQSAIVNTPRFEHATVNSERRPVMRLGQARTNIVVQSEDLGTSWSATGTPTRSAAAIPASVMGVALDLIGDDSAAALEGYTNSIVFTGNGQKAFSVFVKKGTAGGSFVGLIDTTAGARRVFALISFSAAGVPAVDTGGIGSYLGYVECGGGVYRLLFTSAAVTAANNHSIEVYPATTGAIAATETGTIYIGGFQAENAVTPSSYIKTTTGSATRAADTFYWDHVHVPQAMMAYIRLIDHGNFDGTNGLFGLDGGSNVAPQFAVYNTNGTITIYHHNGIVAAQTVTVAGSSSYGQAMELVAMLTTGGAVRGISSIAGAAVTDSGASAGGIALPSAWSGTRLYLNDHTAAFRGLASHAELKIVKYADVAAATAQGIMDELRSFEISAAGEVIS